jgi:hypothetical protein
MDCHYCDDVSQFSVEKDGVKVFLCQEHLSEQIEELGENLEESELSDMGLFYIDD